jgi:adenylate cyclase
MEVMSDCVIEHGGVLVDYIGDELMAMWGAPQAEPRHAELACAAARDMLLRLPQCGDTWTALVGEPTCVGIGINSGIARVGNTGTTRRFKYGPLGGTVNVASRVQGATKHLKVDLLITGDTRATLSPAMPVRYLGKVRLVNIREAVALYEVPTRVGPEWPDLCARFGQGLEHFERKEFQQAAALLGELLATYPNDGPSIVLLSRAVEHLSKDGEAFTADWVLPGK